MTDKPQHIFRIVHNQENPFVMIDRTMFEKPIMSWAAKGVLGYLLSRPDHWIVNVMDLVNRSTDGEASVRSIMKELAKHRHLQYAGRERRGDGTLGRAIWNVYERPLPPDSENHHQVPPDSDLPNQVEPNVVEPNVENRDVSNNNLSNIKRGLSEKTKRAVKSNPVWAMAAGEEYEGDPRLVDLENIRQEWESRMRQSPNWALSGWNDFPAWLLEKQEQGQTVLRFARWFRSDKFRKDGIGMWTPGGDKYGRFSFKSVWLQAFEDPKPVEQAQPKQRELTPFEMATQNVDAF